MSKKHITFSAIVASTLAVVAASSSFAADKPQALVRHRPPLEATAGDELRIVAVIDNDWAEGGIVVRYRKLGGTDFSDAPFERSSAGGYYATIPGDAVVRPGLEYFISGQEGSANHFASAGDPHIVRVRRDPDSAWREAELFRLGGRRYSVALDTQFQSFGNSSGRDRYVRAELDWSYRLISRLYSISLGFGFLEGDTPANAMPDAMNLQRGYRYGYGGVRLRARESVWIDARASLGFGDEGFSPGAGGQLILGDDWRTCVKIGVEYSEALSYRAWVTLQWDTVPGVLMSATAATTDQPRSEIDSGSYIVYRLTLPVSDRFSLTGKLSYGGRGNRPGGIGGGLATEMRF